MRRQARRTFKIRLSFRLRQRFGGQDVGECRLDPLLSLRMAQGGQLIGHRRGDAHYPIAPPEKVEPSDNREVGDR